MPVTLGASFTTSGGGASGFEVAMRTITTRRTSAAPAPTPIQSIFLLFWAGSEGASSLRGGAGRFAAGAAGLRAAGTALRGAIGGAAFGGGAGSSGRRSSIDGSAEGGV